MKKIYLITNYRGAFGNKYKTTPHHSGMNKELLSRFFSEYDFDVSFLSSSEIDFRSEVYKNAIILYTTTEDPNGLYKSYIEDIVCGLEQIGAVVIPDFIHLKSHHNKVFMEILRDTYNIDELNNIHTQKFGSKEEFDTFFIKTNLPIVIKKASGASSIGVFLGQSYNDIINKVKIASRSFNLSWGIKEKLRSFKYKNYSQISVYRNKFITQNFIPGLSNDWKVLVYYDKYYIVERPVREHDFRASGSGKEKYLFGKQVNIPAGLLNYVNIIFDKMNVAMLSIDIAQSNNQFYTLEFQFTGFGTSGQQLSNEYFKKIDGEWIVVEEKLLLEKVYTDSVVKFYENIKRNE